MTSAIKAALINTQANYIHIRAALFHSTPFLDRGRRNRPDFRFNNYARRSRKQYAKQTLLRNLGAYTDLFEDWQSDFDEDDPLFSSKGSSWFKKQNRGRGSRRRRGRRGFEFCEDDVDVETILRSTCGGTRSFFWSFVNEENPDWRSSSSSSSSYKNYRSSYSSKSSRTSWNSRSRFEDDSSSESDDSELGLTSDRLALGLRSSGPLKLEEVKNAYRVCALKWHPDRHQGTSKAMAEEKFKLCSAAYQTLCDKLSLD